MFLIVNKRTDPVLLGLLARISAECWLLTDKGSDMMSKVSSAMRLNLSKLDFPKPDEHCERTAQYLNKLACKLIEKGPVQNAQVSWKKLDFEEFGL